MQINKNEKRPTNQIGWLHLKKLLKDINLGRIFDTAGHKTYTIFTMQHFYSSFYNCHC